MTRKDDVVRGYAQAIFTIATAEDALRLVEDELFAFAKAVEQHAELGQALGDPSLTAENKKALIRELLGDRAHPLTTSVLGFVVESGRGRELRPIVEELAAVAAQRRKHALAEVRTAVPINDEQRDRIAGALARATGKSVEVKVVVDPSVVGGVVAHVGDEVFDGSVRTRLSEARQRLGSM